MSTQHQVTKPVSGITLNNFQIIEHIAKGLEKKITAAFDLRRFFCVRCAGSSAHVSSDKRRCFGIWHSESATQWGRIQPQNTQPCQEESTQTTGKQPC